ncbi:unannotated protein [freshwater metagenome]|uniref:Unannotated protein n=1 Tax=freshwater metagenome TaxID=449393 RepID=A0A6J7RUG9_9ZZZZ|nr:hypothetical protein [Actinomycetota bacterium]MSW36575.1 hypothetical protein [Actinomycetota bacterium]
MSMLSGTVLGSSGKRRRRHPVVTGLVVLLMMGVLFGATFGAVRLLRGGGTATPEAIATTPAPCVTVTSRPGQLLPEPSTITVNVFNATGRVGLAKSSATDLTARGFVIGRVANDPLGASLTGIAEIRYGTQGLANAQLVQFYLVGATLSPDKRTDATVDVVLGQKYTVVADQQAVTAALAQPVPTTSGAGCPVSPTSESTSEPTSGAGSPGAVTPTPTNASTPVPATP